ncbi:oligoribonuclease [Novimethylophilus kurashikiensis]|uniref:Oligoribonuclease n=1 Tax=Novimethylophilus kurashikiensis TaxID=1825523 RepID=A0A2R5FI84_9PROT|nr:oligoribonuclease [Novimethylophilus kurashikiensis]
MIRDLPKQVAQGMAAMMPGKTAIMRSRLRRSSFLKDKGRILGLLVSRLNAKTERPALYVCRKDKNQQQGNAADKTTHGVEFTQESTGRQFS